MRKISKMQFVANCSVTTNARILLLVTLCIFLIFDSCNGWTPVVKSSFTTSFDLKLYHPEVGKPAGSGNAAAVVVSSAAAAKPPEPEVVVRAGPSHSHHYHQQASLALNSGEDYALKFPVADTHLASGGFYEAEGSALAIKSVSLQY